MCCSSFPWFSATDVNHHNSVESHIRCHAQYHWRSSSDILHHLPMDLQIRGTVHYSHGIQVQIAKYTHVFFVTCAIPYPQRILYQWYYIISQWHGLQAALSMQGDPPQANSFKSSQKLTTALHCNISMTSNTDSKHVITQTVEIENPRQYPFKDMLLHY